MNGFSASHKSKNANFVGEDIILPPLGQMILFEEREGKPLPYGVKQYAVRRYNVCSYRLFDNGRIWNPPLRCKIICGAPSLARVILSERSESNCEAVGGEAEQDLTCHAGSRRLEKGYFIKEREGKPLPYRNVIFLHSAEMFVRTVCLKTGG